MAFKRGRWGCTIATCTREGEYSVIVHMRTAGGRKERTQKLSPALRVCRAHMEAIKKGKPPLEIIQAAQSVAKQICVEQ